jgi:hypothetical protein
MALPSKRNSIDLLSVRVLMNMPNPIHSNKENYEEGVVYIYTFNDGGGIILHEGALMQFEIDSYKPSFLCTIISVTPPTSELTHGTPNSIASPREFGLFSIEDADKKTFAFKY